MPATSIKEKSLTTEDTEVTEKNNRIFLCTLCGKCFSGSHAQRGNPDAANYAFPRRVWEREICVHLRDAHGCANAASAATAMDGGS